MSSRETTSVPIDEMYLKHWIISISLLLAAIPAVAQVASESYIGKAGSQFITEEEFLKRYELMPGLNRNGSRREEDKLVTLYSIIAEKLLAQEAVDRRLDQDSLFLQAFAEIEHALVRDELYREEVAGKVHVSDAELRKGIEQALRQKQVAYRFFEHKDDAEFVRRRIKTSADFLHMQVDSLMAAPIDTATVIWSDADPVIERTAYALQVGEVSPIVQAGSGYYIFLLRSDRPNPFYVNMQLDVRRERVLDRLRLRKEKIRLNEYMEEVLKGKTAFARPVPMQRIATALAAVLKRSSPENGQCVLTAAGVQELHTLCAGVINDTVAVTGKVAWSVRDVLDRLFNEGFSIAADDTKNTAKKLNNQMRVWAQQEVLAQEALQRGLASRPSVRRDIDMWRQSFLAGVLRGELNRRVSVSDADVYNYMQSAGERVAPSVVQLRELRTATITDMQKAMGDLENHVPFEDVVRRWSNDPAAAQNGGLTTPFPVTQRPPVGEIATAMHEGEFYGPVNTDQGWLYFQLVSKKSAGPTDTTFVARRERAERDVRAMKERYLQAQLVSQLAQRKGFTIYEDRLKALKVSPVPMMTFRVLGFGGRMFAVPMVQRQIDWLDIEPPEAPVLP